MAENKEISLKESGHLVFKFMRAAADFGRGFVRGLKDTPIQTLLFTGAPPAVATVSALALVGVHGVGPFGGGEISPHTSLFTQSLMFVWSAAASAITGLNAHNLSSTGKRLRNESAKTPDTNPANSPV